MDWDKGIRYGQTVNAAYDAFAGKASVPSGYDLVGTIYANDLATRTNPHRGKTRVLMGLLLQGQDGEAITAIRGTVGLEEWFQDAQFLTRPFSRVPEAGNSEDGFTEMYLSMTLGETAGAGGVVDALPAAPWKRPVTAFTVCGHSLGGALATLLALDAAANAGAPFNVPAVYTYASPRTGDDGFRARYEQLVHTTFRIVDNVDIVPNLPADPPYKHVASKIKLKSLTLIPPRLRLQPNPICWHVLPSYLYLMSLAAHRAGAAPDANCKPSWFLKGLAKHLRSDFRSIGERANEFSGSERPSLGGS
jgi:pimeloyl-ACP methyl ester carboxylesterase